MAMTLTKALVAQAIIVLKAIQVSILLSEILNKVNRYLKGDVNWTCSKAKRKN